MGGLEGWGRSWIVVLKGVGGEVGSVVAVEHFVDMWRGSFQS